MYRPPVFREDDAAELQALIRAHPFATLVTLENGAPCGTHIPFVLTEGGAHGVLQGHVARPNTIWSDHDADSDVLVIFQGAEHYITPSWYASKAEHGKVVPTWNYDAAHVYGRMTSIEDPDWLIAHLNALTNFMEDGREVPWRVSDAPEDYIGKMVRGIVGIEIGITRLEGKSKMSQNRNPADREGTVAGLEAEGTDAAREVARRITRRIPG